MPKQKLKIVKSDPVKEFQKQCVDQRVCLFYVADRVKGILDGSTSVVEVRDKLQEFEDELVRNIGINELIKRFEYREDEEEAMRQGS